MQPRKIIVYLIEWKKPPFEDASGTMRSHAVVSIADKVFLRGEYCYEP